MGKTVDLLANLTPPQREAVTHVEGPLLVLAGPGSGKTRVITRRVAYLLHQGIRPSQILAITFTNKAAAEMRKRVEELVPGCKVWVSTFHSLGVRLLRQYADRLELDRNFTIYDQPDRNKLVKEAMEAAGIDNVRLTPARVQAAISKAKNQLETPDKYAKTAGDYLGKVVARVYPIYEKKLRENNAMDFDDLLLWPALALKNDAELRQELDERFRFVLIDEYQDTNHAQYSLARALKQDQPNLCVVGDPDQSIYGWRGSDIRNILDFERDYAHARVITLDQNYRSTQVILQAASSVIAHNRERKAKALFTENPRGEPVLVLTFESGLDEAEAIARRIQAAVQQKKRSPRDFAIFLRVNALSRSLELALARHKVPYQMVRGLAFFERKENRDILAYLRLLVNPRDALSFERIVNEPPRGIGETSLKRLKEFAGPREMSLLAAAAEVERIPTIKGKAVKGLQEFVRVMGELYKLRDAQPDVIIRQVIEQSGYRRMLLDSTDDEDQNRLANIEELITAAQQFAAEDSRLTLADFLEHITLASDVDSWNDQQDSVSIMTLHAAKGLEFPVVFMPAVEQGLLPHERSLTQHEIEEERRLMFVGMTRAEEELYLSHVRLREFRGQTNYVIPSMFLDELPSDGVESRDLAASGGGTQRAIDEWRTGSKAAAAGWADAGFGPAPKSRPSKDGYEVGMAVEHATYGKGRITDVSGQGALRRVKIRFGGHGEKTFIADKVRLTIIGAS